MSTYITRSDRVSIIADGQSMHSAAVNLDYQIDWKQVLSEIADPGRVLRAYYFTPLFVDEDGFSPVQKLADWLGFNGYDTVSVTVDDVTSEGKARGRRDLIVRITLACMHIAPEVDHIILMTGDSAFIPLVGHIQLMHPNVRITVVSSQNACSNSLRKQSDNFFFF